MAAMFGALNRFISRLDADPASLNQNSYYQQQHQPDTTIGDHTWGFQVLRNKSAEVSLEPWFDFIIGINGHAIVCNLLNWLIDGLYTDGIIFIGRP